MSTHFREKIALVVFGLLILLSLCGLGWYIFAGHSWNVAASTIDDTFGSMDGYTAVIYPGTLPVGKGELAADARADDGDGEGEEGGGAEGGSGADASVAADAAIDDGGDAAVSGEGSPADASLFEGDAAEGSPAGDGSTGDAAAPVTTGMLRADAAPTRSWVTLEAARASYEEKRATVFVIDTIEPETYREGLILKKGNRRLGVCSVKGPHDSGGLLKQVAYFERQKVDFIVVVTPDKRYVDGIPGIDIVLSTRDEELFVMGETIDGTFYVDTPQKGHVGAILISPSNVVSAKDIESL